MSGVYRRQSYTVIATKPALDAINPHELYERDLFSKEDLAALAKDWHMMIGSIQDPGPKYGKRILRFVAKKGGRA
jgi:hypothetical protein